MWERTFALHVHPQYSDACSAVLNEEWPRNATARYCVIFGALSLAILEFSCVRFARLDHQKIRARGESGGGGRVPIYMLGAICGSAQSMDCAAQSVDPYIAQESVDLDCLRDLPICRFYAPVCYI